MTMEFRVVLIFICLLHFGWFVHVCTKGVKVSSGTVVFWCTRLKHMGEPLGLSIGLVEADEDLPSKSHQTIWPPVLICHIWCFLCFQHSRSSSPVDVDFPRSEPIELPPPGACAGASQISGSHRWISSSWRRRSNGKFEASTRKIFSS